MLLSSEKRAKILLTGYYNCQKDSKKLDFHLLMGGLVCSNGNYS